MGECQEPYGAMVEFAEERRAELANVAASIVMAVEDDFMGISHQQDTRLRGAAARTRPACCWFAVERVCIYNRVSLGAMHCIVRMPTLSLTQRTTTPTIGAHKSVWAQTRRLQTYSAL